MSRSSPVLFGLALLVFILPFVSISCGGEKVVTYSGVQLVTGVTAEEPSSIGNEPEEERLLSTQPLVLVAVVAGLMGLLLHNLTGDGGRTFLGALGIAALLLFYAQAATEASRQEIPLSVDLEPGYWLALLFFGAASAVNGFTLLNAREGTGEETRAPPVPEESHQAGHLET